MLASTLVLLEAAWLRLLLLLLGCYRCLQPRISWSQWPSARLVFLGSCSCGLVCLHGWCRPWTFAARCSKLLHRDCLLLLLLSRLLVLQLLLLAVWCLLTGGRCSCSCWLRCSPRAGGGVFGLQHMLQDLCCAEAVGLQLPALKAVDNHVEAVGPAGELLHPEGQAVRVACDAGGCVVDSCKVQAQLLQLFSPVSKGARQTLESVAALHESLCDRVSW